MGVFAAVATCDVPITMSDGTVLRADLTTPDGPVVTRPTMLTVTGYKYVDACHLRGRVPVPAAPPRQLNQRHPRAAVSSLIVVGTPRPVIRVLLVDDVTDVRSLARLVLEQDGRFRVVAEAANGLEAVAMARVTRP